VLSLFLTCLEARLWFLVLYFYGIILVACGSTSVLEATLHKRRLSSVNSLRQSLLLSWTSVQCRFGDPRNSVDTRGFCIRFERRRKRLSTNI
jgi:hypothetical protein